MGHVMPSSLVPPPADLSARTPRDSVAVRLLSLLSAFSPGDEALTLTELAQRTGLPQPTALRLLRALTDWGALDRTAAGSYQIGIRLFQIGMLAPAQRSLREVALPYMQDLFQVTRENVLLGVHDSGSVLYVEKVKGQNSASALTRLGGRLPMHVTAIGKVLLAFGPEEAREAACRQPLRQFTSATLKDGEALREDLAKARDRGYAVANQELRPDRVAVAAPVLNYAGVPVAGLSVMGQARNIDVSRVAPAVLTAALSLSRQLGNASSRPRRR
jgi:DNA-binding IclR family transcriptional regulator